LTSDGLSVAASHRPAHRAGHPPPGHAGRGAGKADFCKPIRSRGN